MLNVAILTGRLTAAPELKKTPDGKSVTTFSIAVDRKYKSGEEKITDFINIVAWRQTAEFITKYFQKGSLIGIEGRIQTRNYTDKNGNKRTAFEVVAENVHFMESKAKADINIEREEQQSFSNDFTNDFSDIEPDDDLPF